MEIEKLLEIPRVKRPLHCAIHNLIELFLDGMYEITIRKKGDKRKRTVLTVEVSVERSK